VSILKNAVDSIAIGLEDFSSSDQRRVISCTRNIVTIQHFEDYVESLRNSEDSELINNFKTFVTSHYAVGGGESIIGMTYDEFAGKA
jgi:hypothetical protein